MPLEFVSQLEQNMIEHIDNSNVINNGEQDDINNNSSKKLKINHQRDVVPKEQETLEPNVLQNAKSSEFIIKEENAKDDIILFQIDDVVLKRKDIQCLFDRNWLNDACILAFMKSLNTNKNILILNPMQTSKFLVEKSIQDSEIFPKVIYHLI